MAHAPALRFPRNDYHCTNSTDLKTYAEKEVSWRVQYADAMMEVLDNEE